MGKDDLGQQWSTNKEELCKATPWEVLWWLQRKACSSSAWLSNSLSLLGGNITEGGK